MQGRGAILTLLAVVAAVTAKFEFTEEWELWKKVLDFYSPTGKSMFMKTCVLIRIEDQGFGGVPKFEDQW